MDTPVQDIIVGNIPGARGPDTDIKPRDVKYTSQCIVDTPLSTDKQLVETVPETDCLAECAHLTITVSQIEQDIGRKSSFSHSPLAFDACNEVGFVQYITTHSYHGVIEVRIAIQVYGDCSPHSNSHC